MIRFDYSSLVLTLSSVLILSTSAYSSDLWGTPFKIDVVEDAKNDSILSLNDIFLLVAKNNSAFKSIDYQLKAAQGEIRQAGTWSNPEVEAEIEEFGWDSPGFKESEFTLSVSQDLELLGQRKARITAARAKSNETATLVKLSVFDLYLETKRRFYDLYHAQVNIDLSRKAFDLAGKIVDNIKYRLDKGVALHSELLLAELEKQRALLSLEQAVQENAAKETYLTALWMSDHSNIKVRANSEPDHEFLLKQIEVLPNQIDSSRQLILSHNELNVLETEKAQVIAESRPILTLSGGIKRFEADKSKSFLIGLSLPIPLFNRNQGTLQSIESQIASLRFTNDRELVESTARIKSQIILLKKLLAGHATIDSMLLPTAEKAYKTLRESYEAGRVPYVQLLEAERALNDLSFEHNNMLLSIQRQIIELEYYTGVILSSEKEK